MSALTRRMFISSTTALASIGVTVLAFGQETGAEGAGIVSLEEALQRRESIRTYAPDALPDDVVLRVLWAANGINRPDVDGHTAPSARSAYDVEIYLATPDGVSIYDPAASALAPFLDGDVREAGTSAQRFVHAAPAVLIYVSDHAKLIEAGYDPDATSDLIMTGRVNAAIMAQNVYLFAAAEGLGTCLVGGINRAELQEALGLGEGKVVAFIQPIGRPA